MEKRTKEFSNLLVIRNHLAKIPQSQLLEMYQDYDYYLAFLNSIWLLIENDSGFLLFDENFVEKILSIIQIHRFDAKDEGVKEVINEIIECMNTIKSYPNDLKKILKNNYLAYQETTRKATFYTTKGLLDSLSYDAIVFSALKDNTIDSIHYDEHYLLSLNYLMEECPDMFHDEEIRQRAIKRLQDANTNTSLLSKKKLLIKETTKRLNQNQSTKI